MEELKLKYIRILIGFIIVIVLSSVTIKNQIKNITKTKEFVQTLEELDNEAKKEEIIRQNFDTNIPQVRIAQEVSENIVNTEEDALNNDYVKYDDSQNNNEFEKEGLKKMGEGDYDSAILYLEQAFEKGSIDAKKRTANYLVQCYEQKGEITGIVSVYDRLISYIQDDKEKIEINNKLAFYFIKMGNKEQALRYYEDNYALDNSKENLILIGDILIELGDRDKLSSYVQSHLMSSPQDEEFLKKYIDFISLDKNSQE